MSSIYTLVTMALIRYSSVVRFERSWHTTTHDDFFTSRYVHAIWVLSLLIAIPPTFGIGKYTPDVGLIRYIESLYLVFCIALFHNTLIKY